MFKRKYGWKYFPPGKKALKLRKGKFISLEFSKAKEVGQSVKFFISSDLTVSRNPNPDSFLLKSDKVEIHYYYYYKKWVLRDFGNRKVLIPILSTKLILS